MRNQLTRTLLVAAALSLTQAPLLAQESRLVGRLPDAERTQIDSLLQVAQTRGLPTEPLVDRALEGAAKRAPANLIVRAADRLLVELTTAQRAFGDSSTAGELTAGASALRAGASEVALRQLRERRSSQSLTVAASVLADLVAVGVPADTAVVAVLALADRLPDAQYIAFQRNVERDIAMGASPSAALGVRFRGAASFADAAAPTAAPGGLEGGNPQPNRPPRRRKP